MKDAPPARSIVKGTQLKRARELLLLTPEEVSAEIDIPSHQILSWELEKSHPTLRQLEDLARIYEREIDYFLRDTPAPPKAIEFRGRPGQSLSALPITAKAMLAKVDELCRTALELESLLNIDHESKLPSVRKTDSPKEIANAIRGNLLAKDKPIPDLKDRLDNLGIRIFELAIPDDAFSGFSFRNADYGPCILLNAREIKGRRNFTLAHELAHLICGHGSSICYIPLKPREVGADSEVAANRFAVELLLPETGMVRDFASRGITRKPTLEELKRMSYKWGVSVQALGYRLESLNLSEKGITDRIRETKPEHIWRPKAPKWERQLGKGYVKTAIESYNKNLISVGRLAHALQIPIRNAMKLVEGQEK
ncbi:MAG TPA: XRE family transcriptional regulator [bacterium]|jgi:Zn-dependent peptidase ImmA (M78 family)/DNA-binding XRE family transcriptional regulator